MADNERNTDNQIKSDAFVRRMPSHRSQRPQRRAAEQAANAEPVVSAAVNEVNADTEAVSVPVTEQRSNTGFAAENIAAAQEDAALPVSDILPPAEETKADETGAEVLAEDGNSEAIEDGEAQKQPENKSLKKPAKKPAGKGAAAVFKDWVKSHKQLTAILATVLVLVIVLIVLFANGSTLSSRKNGNYMDQIRSQEIKENDVAAIDDFFIAYYTALSSGNTTDLEAMFDDPSKANITTEISTIVSQYDNFKVYVTQGIEEGDIIAFVSNDIHFDNIDATAPSVDSYYLKYDKEASVLKICSDMYTDQDILKYMNLVSYREPIRSLLSDTNSRLSDALAGNKDLNNLYILMQSMTESADMNQDAETVETEE